MLTTPSSLGSEFDANRFALITSFVAVAEHLSFVDAADALNIKPSTVSRQISRLENALGVRLFARTTRRIALTEAGLLYCAECRRILEHLSEAEALVRSLNAEPRGSLRITAPIAFGRLHLNTLLAEFLALYPKVSIEANFSDRYVDVIGERYDVAVRIGNLPSSGLIARKIGQNQRYLVASPKYLESHGTPRALSDLAHHNCLRFSQYSSQGSMWHLTAAGSAESVQVSGNFASDCSESVFQAAVAGAGIGLVAGYLAADAFRQGQLTVIMPEYTSCDAGIYALYPDAKHLPAKVAAFVSFLTERLRVADWSLGFDKPRLVAAGGVAATKGQQPVRANG